MSIKGTTYWVPVGLTPTIQDCLPFGDADFAESPEFIRLWRIIEGSRYVTTASPSMPWICSILDFCNVRVNEELEELPHCR